MLVYVLLSAIVLITGIHLLVFLTRRNVQTPVDEIKSLIQSEFSSHSTGLLEGLDKNLRESGESQERARAAVLRESLEAFQNGNTEITRLLSQRFDVLDKGLGDRFEKFGKDTNENFATIFKDLRATSRQLLEDVQKNHAALISRTESQAETTQKALSAHKEALETKFSDLLILVTKQQSEARKELTTSIEKFQEAVSKFNKDTGSSLEALKTAVDEKISTFVKEISTFHGDARRELTASIEKLQESVASSQKDARAEITKSLSDLSKSVIDNLDKTRIETTKSLADIKKDSQEQLDKIRGTVDQKLQETLEKRLTESFGQVAKRLEEVHQGLGEMKTLASGVGDLKKVLTNIKTRGTFGEIQLKNLLEQVFIKSQYEENCVTMPGSADRVEFAIKLPGRGDEDQSVYLPIDSKFPQEDFNKLLDAFDAADPDAVTRAQKGLKAYLLGEGSTIASKYLSPPHTTDFAIMFLPTEGLYAEALRIDGLADELQRIHRIVIAGPTTLFAVLNSLQMGFRTLAIEKRSSEVWKILGAVKTDFGRFSESLTAVSKKLDEASNKIADSVKKSRAVNKVLRDVQELPVNQVQALLPEVSSISQDDDEAI